MPSPVRFAVVRKMLERCGYTLDRISGSQHYFVKAGSRGFVIPIDHSLVKAHYVKEIRKECGGDQGE